MSVTTSSLVFGQGSLNVMANVPSTFCFAKELTGTKAMELYNFISETLILKGVSFDKLVAQTYDGALNMKEALKLCTFYLARHKEFITCSKLSNSMKT